MKKYIVENKINHNVWIIEAQNKKSIKDCLSKEYKIKVIPLFLLISFILVMGLASAATLGSFGQNQCVNIKQTCGNCTYVNITSIEAKDNNGKSVTLGNNLAMTKSGTDYTYNFCNTGYVGEYTAYTQGNPDGVIDTEPVTFTIGVNSILLFIIAFVIIYFIGFFGFFGKHIWVSMIGGLAMIGLGLFTLVNGIADYRILITNIISLTTIGLGALFALTSGIELIQENV